MKLDEKGRCCGRKPIHYKGGGWRSPANAPFLFCDRCDREFTESGEQRENFAWVSDGQGDFAQRHLTGRETQP